MYKVVLSKKAAKDRKLLKEAGLENSARNLLGILQVNPFQNPPPYESLRGNLTGLYSRRINYKHRIVYSVIEQETTVHVLRMWTHYEQQAR